VTVGELVDELEIPQGTAYDYVKRLEGAGLLERTNDSRPYEYAAEAISLTLSVDGTTTTITPALVAAIARLEDDKDVEVFVERHGLDGLVEALEGYHGEGEAPSEDDLRELGINPEQNTSGSLNDSEIFE
jgi:hypothetical protein